MLTQYQQQAIEAIERQQKGIENTAPWVAGEQLKDICRREPDSAELIAQDLAVPEMSLVSAEKKIKAYADKHKKGNFSHVPPQVADGILREFYGLRKPDENAAVPEPKPELKIVPPPAPFHLDFEDFM